MPVTPEAEINELSFAPARMSEQLLLKAVVRPWNARPVGVYRETQTWLYFRKPVIWRQNEARREMLIDVRGSEERFYSRLLPGTELPPFTWTMPPP